MAKMKIVIDERVDEKNIRLKATDNSATFGLVTAGSQIVFDGDGFLLSNYDNSRITTTSEVSSLADEVVSIEGMSGEDLIILSTGDRKPSVIGEVKAVSQELNPREMTVKVNSSNPRIIDVLDTKSGDFLGSRTLSSSNNFLFRDFDWILDGGVSAGDEFQVLTSGDRKDDGTNLDRMIALSAFSESTGKGGYTEQYNSLITSAGYNIKAAEQNLINAKTAHVIALDRKSEFSGVDLDTEAAKLLEQQQAYQALARVLSTAKELLDTLLRSM
jgi:flagellar hook-associated protein 1 FlgK